MSIQFPYLSHVAGRDGASEPVLERFVEDQDDLNLVFEAWSYERHASIEMELLLARTTRLLTQVARDEQISEARRDQVKRLLASIRAITDGLRDEAS